MIDPIRAKMLKTLIDGWDLEGDGGKKYVEGFIRHSEVAASSQGLGPRAERSDAPYILGLLDSHRRGEIDYEACMDAICKMLRWA